MKKTKRAISVLIAIAMFILLVPSSTLSVLAYDATSPQITVSSISAAPGETATVDVIIKNNPGILGAVLSFSFDEGLTLVDAVEGEAFSVLTMTKPGAYASTCQFVWDGQDISAEDIKNGTVISLKVQIADDVEDEKNLNITVSYGAGDIVDRDLQPVDVNAVSGKITVVRYLPGDLNGDKKVNTTDVILLRRHIAGGYNATINTLAGDVNDDSKFNTTDVILVRRYIAGGYNVTLKPSHKQCSHTMKATAAKAANCTEQGNIEYWYCSSCEKYFRDADGVNEVTAQNTVIAAKGHTVVIDEAVPATYTATGLTEGKHCSVCNAIITAQEVVPKLQRDEYSIRYYLDNNDNYLKTVTINNTNPTKYSSDEAVVLEDLLVDGYIFKGWYDGQASNAQKVTSIPKGETGNKVLYAQWEKVVYTVTFDSPLIDVPGKTYTTDVGVTLQNQTLSGYVWLGWSDDKGNIVKSIDPGTTGNIILHANWTSSRNQASPVKKLGTPIIDESDGSYLFAYEIGTVVNVPLYQIKYFGNSVAGSPLITESESHSGRISQTNAQVVANTVSNATTKTSSWALSKDWNSISSVSESHAQEMGIDTSKIDFDSTSSSATIALSKNEGASEGKTVNYGVNGKIYGSNTTEVGAEAKFPVKCVNVGVSLKNTSTIGGEIGGHYDKTTVNDSYWNTNKSFTGSASQSHSTQTSTNLSQKINDVYGYSQTQSVGGSSSSAEAIATAQTSSEEYSSSFSYSTEEITSTQKTYTYNATVDGYWRQVIAGTVHVFGVVTYDIATSTYSVFTYNVLDENSLKEFMDYSRISSEFNDNENGVIPFEVPIFVNDYITNAVGYTEGLSFNRSTGMIDGYDGTAKYVHIPDYMTLNNGDGTYSAFKVKGIESDVFAGNTDITEVRLGNLITAIPDNAFNGCTSLKTVSYNTLSAIGEKAFYGCTALSKFTVSKDVVTLGADAFTNAPEVLVEAANTSVVDSAISCGAKSLTINLKSTGDELKNKSFAVAGTTEEFTLNGRGADKNAKTYSNIKIESKAKSTTINGMTFVDNSGVPLKLESENVTLIETKIVNAPGIAMVLNSGITNLHLQGDVNISTAGQIAVLCKNVDISKVTGSNESCSMSVSDGDIYVCGNIVDSKSYLNLSNSEIVIINEESFNNLLNNSFEWVLASEAPSNAQILAEKWTYDLTTTTSSSSNTLDGWQRDDSKTTYIVNWNGATNYYDKQQSTNETYRYIGTRSVENGTQTYLYRYYSYIENSTTTYKKNSTYVEQGYWVSTGSVYSYDLYHSGQDLYMSNEVIAVSHNYPCWKGGTRTVYKTQYGYQSGQKVYTYYFYKVEPKESTTDPTGTANVSNVLKYVKYITK